ncbi:MAG: class I SAM-dependent methyltransferase [Ilumatobacteraceae bacterium]|nr:MAG: class I SAM-dependent methyltransferase [Actinomycetota bacterium]
MSGPRRDLRRTAELFSAFRAERHDPARLYTMMARDVVATVAHWQAVRGADVLDVGGGPGYVADAFDDAGATCVTVDPSSAELALHGRSAQRAIVADGQRLPFADATFDVVHCSNVLEHVPAPRLLLGELGRCCRPGGVVYLSFTNWLSPWGGHEISPWHYFGAERAVRRYEARGETVKNVPGESLYRLSIGEVVRWIRDDDALSLLSLAPRYYPSWARAVVRLPGAREVLTWNLEAVMRRTAYASTHDPHP